MVCRNLHLPRNVLWYFLPPWMGCHRHGWAYVLPHRHREEAHDDDLRGRS